MIDVAEAQPGLQLAERVSPQPKRVIGAVSFEVTDHQGAVGEIGSAIRMRSSRVFAFCNMHTFNLTRRIPALATALSKATVFNDGLGIDVAGSILYGKPFPANLNGTDLTPMLLESFDRPVNVYLVGSPPGVADKAAKILAERFPHVSVAGCHHGFFADAESEQLVQKIRASSTDLLLLGMGNPRQELWATEVASKTGAVVLCVGAFFDFASGRVSRAPLIVRKLRCEWLYRFMMEPARLWRRYFGGAVPFLYAVLKQKLGQNRQSGQIRSVAP